MISRIRKKVFEFAVGQDWTEKHVDYKCIVHENEAVSICT